MSEGKVAIVTGGGTGIGKHSAFALLQAGYSVTIAGRRQEMLDEAVEASYEIEEPGIYRYDDFLIYNEVPWAYTTDL